MLVKFSATILTNTNNVLFYLEPTTTAVVGCNATECNTTLCEQGEGDNSNCTQEVVSKRVYGRDRLVLTKNVLEFLGWSFYLCCFYLHFVLDELCKNDI